ncbi:MAG: hypothetical protein ACRDU4_22175, partial [Mycobacterium sp.]
LMGPKMGPQLGELNSLFSRFDPPPGGQYSGWYQYMDRDFRNLLSSKRLPDQFNLNYCGGGNLAGCQSSVWAAIEAAGTQLTTDQGTANPSAWRADATAERIQFGPLPLLEMRYTNRPSGIQQVISFKR